MYVVGSVHMEVSQWDRLWCVCGVYVPVGKDNRVLANFAGSHGTEVAGIFCSNAACSKVWMF